MPVPQSSDDCNHCGHLHAPDLGGGLKRTHPLRVSFLHSHGHSGTSSVNAAQDNDSNFCRGHAQRQTTPNIFGQLPKRQILHTRSNSHQHIGLIDAEGRIKHYCPFHGPVEPHEHTLSHTQTTLINHLRKDEPEDSSSSSTSTSSDTEESEGRSESSVEITFKSQSSKLESGQKGPVKPKRKGCWQWNPLRHAMLISCYVLLLLLAVLVGVVVSQSHRLSSRRRQPVQGGNFQIRQRPGAPALPQGPPIRIDGGVLGRSGGSVRRRRPTTSVPPPPPPPTTTTTTTTTTTELPVYDYEYDYEYLDTHASSAPVAPSPPPAASTTFRPLPPPTSRPVQNVRKQQTVGRPVDRQTFRSGASDRQTFRSGASDRQTFRSAATSPPRRQGVSLANIDQDFTLNDEPEVRGRKEPTVQIARAWSHQNPDGTFTWGYINSDGSFKNETKGTDCVVRGSYGYVDEATGQEIVVPYATGNPCNLENQDPVGDYADYDVQGFLRDIRGGAPANEPAPVAARRPQQQQQQFDSSGSLRNRKF